METSRELHYKSSSTSSSNAEQSHLTKSHWGNTAQTPGTFLTNKSQASKTQINFKPSEITASSGYMADSSSAKTPAENLKKKFANSPSAITQGKVFHGTYF